MATSISIDPLTRIEGHLAIRIETDGGRVTQGFCAGEMFRGFEAILRGRDPLDAQQITQRICGVCPVSHGVASTLAQEDAYGVHAPANGRVARNLTLAANYIQSHILHFYHLSAVDFVDVTAVRDYGGKDPVLRQLRDWVTSELSSGAPFPAAPLLPRYEGDYIEDAELNLAALRHYVDALEARQLAHQAAAVFGGKMPHVTGLVPGGVTRPVTADQIAFLRSVFARLRTFVETSYVPDVLEVAKQFSAYFELGKGCGNFLAFGVFEENDGGTERFLPAGVVRGGKAERLAPGKITEDVRHSFLSSPTGLHPASGETAPAPEKGQDAYSWLKAPRYDGDVMEVGPLARLLVAYHTGRADVRSRVDGLLKALDASPAVLDSALGRHAARALECALVAERCAEWVEELRPGQSVFQAFEVPEKGAGAGLTEAPRGALGHWIEIADHRIRNYQCVVPTTWNCSPRDDAGHPGAVEQALAGTPIANPDHPIEAARVVRSFDPCIACAVH